MPSMVEAEFVLPATGPQYKLLLVPSWVSNPTVVQRKDGKNEILLRVTRRYASDIWLISPEGRRGTLVAFRLSGEGRPQGDPRDVQLEVHVPPQLGTNFRVHRLSA